jgi:TonB family protein
MPKGSIEISIYQAPMPMAAWLHHGRESRRGDRRGRIGVAILAAITSLALQALFLGSIEWGLGTSQARLTKPKTATLPGGEGAEDSAMQWIDLTESDGERESARAPPIDDKDLAQALKSIAMTELPAPTTTEAPGAGSDTHTIDAATAEQARSAMYARYVGQVDARIERAWLRPRTPIGAAMFSCTVRVEQDEAGDVHEVTLVRCNGDARWQQSLVRAIQSASPLPAPPEQRLFKRVIRPTFHSQAYSAVSNPDLYEPDEVGKALPP